MAYTKYVDPSVNAFTKTNLYYVDDPFIAFQDPTYLGFKLFFLFDQPDSGLLSSVGHPNTAMGYLLRRGETVRAEYLDRFIKLLKRINQDTPWFFQGISGLDEAWKRFEGEEDYSPKISQDRKITIDCLDESVDLRMTALMDLYRKACFDWANRREIVPRNLRRFTVSIYCYENRRFNIHGTPTGQAGKNSEDRRRMNVKLVGTSPDEFDRYKTDSVNENISRIMFTFQFCEFLPDETNKILTDVSNSEYKVSKQSIAFSYRNVIEDNLYTLFSDKRVVDKFYRGLDEIALDRPQLSGGYYATSPQNPKYGVLENEQSAINDVFGNLFSGFQEDLSQLTNAYGEINGIQNSIENKSLAISQNAVNALVQRLLLGNVYGFSPNSILENSSAGVQGLIENRNRVGSASANNAETDITEIGNVFG